MNNEFLKKLETVNAKIKKHNDEVVKKEAMRKVQMDQLKDLCENYKQNHGTDLWNEDLDKMSENVNKLLIEEEKRVNESLKKAEKLLELIESGNFKALNEELGISNASETKEPEKEEENTDLDFDSLEDSLESSENIIDIIDSLEEETIEETDTLKVVEDLGLDDLFDM